MSGTNIFEALQRNNLSCCGLNYSLYEEFSKTMTNENEIVEKINKYNDYEENNNNNYSENIMQCLRQRHDLNKFDFSKDEELNKLSANDVFDHVIKWNGLLGNYTEIIKKWVNEIYGVDLDRIAEK